MRGFLLVVIFALASATGAIAQGRGQATPVSGQVNEGFDPTARVAGSRIVGVRIGKTSARPFDPASVFVVGTSADQTICVRAISRDGLYWMRTPYRTVRADRMLHLVPFTQAGDRLRRYPRDEIAIYAFETPSPDCLDKSVVVLPVLEDTGVAARFEVLINSGNRRVEARIATRDKSVSVDIPCAIPTAGARITYDRICAAPFATLPAGALDLTLSLTFDDGLSKLSENYSLRLPGPAP